MFLAILVKNWRHDIQFNDIKKKNDIQQSNIQYNELSVIILSRNTLKVRHLAEPHSA